MRLKTFLIASTALLQTACGAPLTASYSPGSVLSGSGDLTVGVFAYVPHESGTLAANQINNTAIMEELRLTKGVAEFFRHAFRSELKFAGYQLESGTVEIVGRINEFSVDDLGSPHKWKLAVRYRIVDRESGQLVSEKDIVAEMNTRTSRGASDQINEVIRLNIVKFMRSREFRSVTS